MPEKEVPDSIKKKKDLNEVLLSWESPSHPFKKRSKVFFQAITAIALLLSVIAFFLLHEPLLIGVILSVVFVVWAISSIPPIPVRHKITHLGFEQAGRFLRWEELYAFWFEEKWGQKILVVQTRLNFPAQTRAVLKEVSDEEVRKVISKYLLYLEKPPKTWVENISDWLSRKIPLEATI